MFIGIPFGLMFLNLIGMVLFFVAIVMAVKLIIRGARGYGGRGRRGPWVPVWAGAGGRHDSHGPHGKRRRHGKHRSHGKHGGHAHLGSRREHRAAEDRFDRPDEALGLVRSRLARGEIDVDEFNAIRSALEA